ncbi:MAG: phosphoribosylglycinamide formyltransferase [Clostridia bacterium]|nr:phosphoribosylglycinamide formyltransferase [Clostridia bacterium]
MRIAVMASGRGSNLQALIDSMERGDLYAEIVAVLSDKKEALALQRARKHGIKDYFLSPEEYPDRESYDMALGDILEKTNVDLICLAGFMRILSKKFVARFQNRIINIHPSLLPAFPGLNAQKQALDYGVKYSGCTVHFVDAGVDTGPIIAQRVVPVYDNDTVESLSSRILEQEHKLYPHVVKLIAQGRVILEGRKVRILEKEDG